MFSINNLCVLLTPQCILILKQSFQHGWHATSHVLDFSGLHCINARCLTPYRINFHSVQTITYTRHCFDRGYKESYMKVTRKKWNDQQLKKLLIAKQILLVSTLWDARRTLLRICIIMSGLIKLTGNYNVYNKKGFIRKSSHLETNCEIILVRFIMWTQNSKNWYRKAFLRRFKTKALK